MRETKRPCPMCGGLMRAYSARKFCSQKCRQKAYRLGLKNKSLKVSLETRGTLCLRCVNCGDKIHSPRLDQKYCSAACKQAMYRQRKRFAAEDKNRPVQLSIPESAYTITNSV